MTIARQVRVYIEGNPAVRECLALGVVNLTALARVIGQELRIEQREAIEAACRRYRRTRDSTEREKAARHVFRRSRIETRGHLALITLLPSEENASKLESSLYELLASGRLLRVVPTTEEIVLVVTESGVPFVSSAMNPEGFMKVRRDLVEVRVRTPESLEEMPGAVAFLFATFAAEGIDILQIDGCYKDTTLLIKNQDLPTAYRVLERMMA